MEKNKEAREQSSKNILMPILFAVGLFAVSVTVVFGVMKFVYPLLSKTTEKTKIAKCPNKGVAHTVTIQNDDANPRHTEAKLCDTLTIINQDERVRFIAFGVHDRHRIYDGITEQSLRKDQSLTVTLNESGAFEFHDHIGDVAKGDFTVAR